MNKFKISFYVLGLVVSGFAQEKSKPATVFTQKANEEVYSKLNFEDTTDFTDVRRGFIATLDDGIIRSKRGNVIVNESDYSFIKGKAPAKELANYADRQNPNWNILTP